MSLTKGKKIQPLSVKISAEFEEVVLDFAEKHERGKSYIVRLLALRGLAQYLRDGQLKITPEDEDILNSPPAKFNLPRFKLSAEDLDSTAQTNGATKSGQSANQPSGGVNGDALPKTYMRDLEEQTKSANKGKNKNKKTGG
jgi:hypothetical protein